MFCSHFEFDRTGSWYEILPIGGAMLAMLFLFSSRLPWTSRVPSYIFVGVNVLTAGREKFKEWTRRKFTRCVDQFQITLNQIQDLVSTMNKSTQFVQEMELIDRGFTLYVDHFGLRFDCSLLMRNFFSLDPI